MNIYFVEVKIKKSEKLNPLINYHIVGKAQNVILAL